MPNRSNDSEGFQDERQTDHVSAMVAAIWAWVVFFNWSASTRALAPVFTSQPVEISTVLSVPEPPAR